MSPPSDAAAAPLRIGVDATNLLTDRRGIGRYVRALLRRWMTRDADRVDITLFVSHPFPSLVAGKLAAEIGVARVAVDRNSAAKKRDLDLVWHPWNGIFFTTESRDVATIHDVWPFVDAPADDPDVAERRQQPFVRAAEHATRIITDSHFSKDEIIRHLGVEADRIDVVALGVDPAMIDVRPARIAMRGVARYVLFVGEAEARKDLATLLAAMARLPEGLRTEMTLVLAGKRATSASVPAGVRVEFAGEVDDARLASLYAGAAVFAFPSRYEGFGLPLLEAMALGAPVVASDAASIPEACGDAAIYFPAGDAQALAEQIERVVSDPGLMASLREKGRRRAGELSWDRCAQATLAIFERVARA